MLGRKNQRTEQIMMDKYIAVIGGANIDIGGKPYNKLIPADSNPGRVIISYGGVGRNIAHNLTKLGIKTELLTTAGGDFLGREMISYCSSEGIITDHIRIDEDDRSSLYLYIDNEEGDMQLAVADMSTETSLTPEYIDSVEDIINGATVAVVDCNLSQEAFDHIMKISRVPVYVDTVSANKSHKIKGHLKGIDTLKPNRIEAEILTGLSINTEEDYVGACYNLIYQGVRRVFITMGSKGIIAADMNNCYITDSYSIEPVNTTGAGDAATAAIAWASTILRERFDYAGKEYNDLVIPSLAANSAASLAAESDETICSTLDIRSILERINNNRVRIRKIK